MADEWDDPKYFAKGCFKFEILKFKGCVYAKRYINIYSMKKSPTWKQNLV